MPGNTAAVGHRGPDPERIARRLEQAEELMDTLHVIGSDKTAPNAVAAIRTFHDRVWGSVVTRNLTHETDDIDALDDAALARRAAEAAARLGADDGGVAPAEVPE